MLQGISECVLLFEHALGIPENLLDAQGCCIPHDCVGMIRESTKIETRGHARSVVSRAGVATAGLVCNVQSKMCAPQILHQHLRPIQINHAPQIHLQQAWRVISVGCQNQVSSPTPVEH